MIYPLCCHQPEAERYFNAGQLCLVPLNVFVMFLFFSLINFEGTQEKNKTAE